jgi:hypothetical protein
MIKNGDPVWYYSGMHWGDSKKYGIVLFVRDMLVEIYSFNDARLETLFYQTRATYWNVIK